MNINEQFEAKEKELEALKAQLTLLQSKILITSCADSNNTGHEPSISVFQRECYELYNLARVTPEQCLNDVKADAIGLAVHRFKYEYEGVLDASSVESFFDEIEADVRNNNG